MTYRIKPFYDLITTLKDQGYEIKSNFLVSSKSEYQGLYFMIDQLMYATIALLINLFISI
jgi:hypothetical protein